MNKIITIGRQYGSGGKEIGKKLADSLEIPFYDKDYLKEKAKESGICEELFENYDEKATSSFLYSLVMDPYTFGRFDMPIPQKVYLSTFDSIRSLAEQGPCVIVGRCADYVLRERADCLNIFIKAPLEKRVARICTRLNVDAKTAESTIYKIDKQRKSYYNFYTSQKWSDSLNYDMVIDSGILGIAGTVEILRDFVEKADE